MAAAEPALQSVPETRLHATTENCPTCDQPIPNEKALEIRARAEAQKRHMDETANARADRRIAAEKERIEAAAAVTIGELREETEQALEKASAEADARVEAALAEGRKAAEADLRQQVAAAEKAKTEAEEAAARKLAESEEQKREALERLQAAEAEQATVIGELREETEKALKKASAEADARVEAATAEGRKLAEADLREQVAAAQQAKDEVAEAAARQLAESEEQKRQAVARLEAVEADRDNQVTARVREVRDALEKDKAEALAEAKAANDAETRKLTGQLEDLQRKLEKQRAAELGEGAEVKLFDALRAEFPGDDIRRVPKGVSGADVLHTVMHNGQDCGTIIYDSKNTGAWRNDYVAKLIQDQTAAKADYAVLSTLKFPAGATQVAVRDGVVVVNPARAVVIVGIIRRQMLQAHTLRLSNTGRATKRDELFEFITSERCAHLLGRIDTESDALLELQATEKRAHDNHWRKEGTLLRSLQKAKAELDVEIASIIGTRDAEEEQS